MKDQIEKVLKMVQDGKVDAGKAAELIYVLKEKEEDTRSSVQPAAYSDKTLKIQVVSADKDNINVNLPINLVKVVLQAGHSIASSLPQSEKYVKDINVDLIIDAIENELDGQIVDVKSANGDTVSVIIG